MEGKEEVQGMLGVRWEERQGKGKGNVGRKLGERLVGEKLGKAPRCRLRSCRYWSRLPFVLCVRAHACNNTMNFCQN